MPDRPDPDPDPQLVTESERDAFAVGYALGYAFAHGERDAESFDTIGPADPYAYGLALAYSFLDAERVAESERVADGEPRPDPFGTELLPFDPACDFTVCERTPCRAFTVWECADGLYRRRAAEDGRG